MCVFLVRYMSFFQDGDMEIKPTSKKIYKSRAWNALAIFRYMDRVGRKGNYRLIYFNLWKKDEQIFQKR